MSIICLTPCTCTSIPPSKLSQRFYSVYTWWWFIILCPGFKCRFAKHRYWLLYLIQSRMRFYTCSASFDSLWKGNEFCCIHHNFTLCQDLYKHHNRINLLHIYKKWKCNDNSLFAFFTSTNDRKQITNTKKNFLQIVAVGEHVYQDNIWNYSASNTEVLYPTNEKTRSSLWQEMYGETILRVSLNKMITNRW